MTDKNLFDAKVGDIVIVQGMWSSQTIEKITGITKSGNYKIGNLIYYSDGRCRGSNLRAWKPNEEELIKLQQEQFIKKVRTFLPPKNLTYKQAVEINKILDLGVEL